MKQEDLIKFYEEKGYKVVDKVTQLNVKINGETYMWHKNFLSNITLNDLMESLKNVK